MSKHSKLVSGIGTNSGKYPAISNSRALREYEAWSSMLKRCANYYWVKFPTYEGITCSENFKSYSFFYEWCQTQVGFGMVDNNGKSWQLDKDLLSGSNKFYSEDTCVFLPQRINSLINRRNNARGDCAIGVRFLNNRFHASCCIGSSVKTYLGSFTSEQEAFQAYKTYKEILIKQVANEYKEQLDPRAYQALMNYQVEITD